MSLNPSTRKEKGKQSLLETNFNLKSATSRPYPPMHEGWSSKTRTKRGKNMAALSSFSEQFDRYSLDDDRSGKTSRIIRKLSIVFPAILVPIALFASLSQCDLDTRNEEPFVSRAKAPPAKRSEKGYGDENDFPLEVVKAERDVKQHLGNNRNSYTYNDQ